MSYNPFMVLITRAIVDLLEDNPTVMEIGNQTFGPETALKQVIERSRGDDRFDIEGLEKLDRMSRKERVQLTSKYYECLGFTDYKTIDANERYDSLVMDLQKDIRRDYGYTETFSLVTNNGTGEHVFDQYSVFRNVHNLTKKNGIMVHILPGVGHVNHGFYNYQPNVFQSLARTNDYRIIALGYGQRMGYGVIGDENPAVERLSPCLLDEQRIDQNELYEQPRVGRPGPLGGLTSKIRRAMGYSTGRNAIGQLLADYEARFRRLAIFAVLRKLSDNEFRAPFQDHYLKDISDPQMRAEYTQ